ncbi:hypothetical protein [Trichococcus palustris]|uniref:hypothetical protein n=1 Tax=Trichococcus palustris TaxID=140314 RepID=UPI0011601A9B|nr:hypothetical protein [Trichococcus palustris]
MSDKLFLWLLSINWQISKKVNIWRLDDIEGALVSLIFPFFAPQDDFRMEVFLLMDVSFRRHSS